MIPSVQTCPHLSLKTLVFNFHELPSEMLDRVVDIKLLNSKAIRSDALIGSFQVRKIEWSCGVFYTMRQGLYGFKIFS